MNKMKPVLKHIGAAVIGLAAVYGGYKALEDISIKYGQKKSSITEYIPSKSSDNIATNPLKEVSLADLAREYPVFSNFVPKENENYPNTKIKVGDIDNDGVLELIVTRCCQGNAGYGVFSIIKVENGNPKYIKQKGDGGIGYTGGLDLKDIDNDGVYEVITWFDAPGQDSLPQADHRSWGEAWKIDTSTFSLVPTSNRIKDDGSFTDESDTNPYNIQQAVKEPDTYIQRPSLENRIYSQPDIGYAQSHNQEEYQITQHYLHGLNLVLKDSVNMLSAQENPLPYDPIVGANVNVTVRARKNNEMIIDEKYYSDGRGIVNLRFPPLQHYKGDTIDICFNIERQPYDIITNACIDIEDLDPQIIKDGRVTRLSRPNLTRGENIAEFYVEKGRSESGIGDLQDITLSLTMYMPDRIRYSDR